MKRARKEINASAEEKIKIKMLIANPEAIPSSTDIPREEKPAVQPNCSVPRFPMALMGMALVIAAPVDPITTSGYENLDIPTV
jgi:hypothetical protein